MLVSRSQHCLRKRFIAITFEYDNSIHHEKNIVHIAHLQHPLRRMQQGEAPDTLQHPLAQGTWKEVPCSVTVNFTGYSNNGAACNNAYYIYRHDFQYNESGDTSYNTFYRFVGTPAIEETAPFPGRAREGAVLFAAGNKLYFGLGEHRRLSHAAEQLDDFWVFDTQSNAWDSIPALFPGGWRTGAVGFTAEGKVYVGTGEDYKDEYGDFYEFTPESNTWRKVGSMTVNPGAMPG